MTPDNEGKKIDPAKLRRNQPPAESKPKFEPENVSAGAIDRVLDFTFNPSREKIREVTYIDRIQARLLPQLDIVDVMWQYVFEVALFRQDATEYERVFGKERPIPPNLIEEFTHRLAQWQKSIGGMNWKSAVDITLAEQEAKAGTEIEPGGADAWKE